MLCFVVGIVGLVSSSCFAQQRVQYVVQDKLTNNILGCNEYVIIKNIKHVVDCGTKQWFGTIEELDDGKIIRQTSTISTSVTILSAPLDTLAVGQSISGTMAVYVNNEKQMETRVVGRIRKNGNLIVHELSIMGGKNIFRVGYSEHKKIPDWVEEIEKESTTSSRIITHEYWKRIRE